MTTRQQHQQPKKLLLAVPWMALGGADRCGLDLLSFWQSKGWQTLTVATRHDSEVHTRQSDFEAVSIVDHVTSERKMFKLIRDFQPDFVVINNSHEAYKWIPIIKKASPSSRVVPLLHMLLPEPWNFETLINTYGEHIDFTLTISDKLALELRNLGVTSEAKTLKWYGFEEPPTNVPRTRHRSVLVPSRLHTQKRPLFVVKVARACERIGVDCTFNIVGSGMLEGTLKRTVRRQGLEHMFEFSGEAKFEDMAELVASSGCVLCPSIDEGIPLIYFEAMDVNTPLAVSDVGAVSELVPPEFMIPFECRGEASKYAQLIKTHLGKPVNYNHEWTFEQWAKSLTDIMDG